MSAVEVSPFVLEDEAPFTGPVTTPPSASWPTPRKYLSAFVMAGMTTIGTLGIVTPAEAAAMQAPVIESHTLPAGAAELPTADPSAAVPALLRRLRKTSGLNWGELASAVGVSRRTIHNWLSGAHIARVHLICLSRLESIVNTAAEGAPDATRARLLRPQANGRSLLDDLGLASSARHRPISSVSLGDLLGPAQGPVEGSTVRVRRPSSLQGGPIPRRPRSDT